MENSNMDNELNTTVRPETNKVPQREMKFVGYFIVFLLVLATVITIVVANIPKQTSDNSNEDSTNEENDETNDEEDTDAAGDAPIDGGNEEGEVDEGVLEDPTVSFDETTKLLSFDFIEHSINFTIPENLTVDKYETMVDECGNESGNISFTNSPILIYINPCGRGGISTNIIDTITAKSKDNRDYEVAVDDCTNVKEAFATEAEYIAHLGQVPDDCRGYQLGFIPEEMNNNIELDPESRVVVEFLFQSTADLEEQNKTDIIDLIEGSEIIRKEDQN